MIIKNCIQYEKYIFSFFRFRTLSVLKVFKLRKISSNLIQYKERNDFLFFRIFLEAFCILINVEKYDLLATRFDGIKL